MPSPSLAIALPSNQAIRMPEETAASDASSVEDICHGQHSSPGDSEEESICAICFEHRPFVNLPCACKINYCANCWDRALATSVTVRGRAQCPSCRSGFQIDFNQDAACLVFSKEERSMSIADWRSRLYLKARPVQIRLLKDFGTGTKSAAQAPACLPHGNKKSDTLLALANQDSSSVFEPLCVCGAVLENIDSRTRIIRMLEDTEPGWRRRVAESDRLLDSLASSSLITCDLCDDIATRTGGVWTCKNGPHTVLHPAAYDVCEKCFSLHAGPANQRRSSEDRSTQTCEHGRSNRCCQICTAWTIGWQRRRVSRSAAANNGLEQGGADTASNASTSRHSAAQTSGHQGNTQPQESARSRPAILCRLLGRA